MNNTMKETEVRLNKEYCENDFNSRRKALIMNQFKEVKITNNNKILESITFDEIDTLKFKLLFLKKFNHDNNLSKVKFSKNDSNYVTQKILSLKCLNNDENIDKIDEFIREVYCFKKYINNEINKINKDHLFNDKQIDQIRYGLVQMLDVDVYAKPEYDHNQMQQIRLGLIEGLDVSQYANLNNDWKQMQQIRIELENNSIE